MRIFLILTFVFLSFVPGLVFSAVSGPTNAPNNGPTDIPPTSPQGDTTLVNPLGEGATLDGLLLKIIDLFILLGSSIIVIMIIYIGFLFVAAQGNPEKISSARMMLLWTFIGGLILLGAKGIAIGIKATVTAITGS
jgi:hypothetical protein